MLKQFYNRNSLKYPAYIALLLLVGASNPIAIKFALNVGWPPYLLGFSRMLFIGIFYLIVFCSVRGNPWGPNRKARLYSFIASLFKGISVIFFYIGLYLIPANRAVILSTFSPIVNLIVVHFLLEQEDVRRNHLIGVFISFIGIILLLASRDSVPDVGLKAYSFHFIAGDVSILLTILLTQLMVVYEKRALSLGASPAQVLNMTTIISVTVFGLFFCFSNERIVDLPMTRPGITTFIYLISVVGVFLFYYRRWLAAKLEVTYINSFSHLGKTLSIFYSYLILGERLSIISLLTFCIILCGTILASAPNTKNCKISA